MKVSSHLGTNTLWLLASRFGMQGSMVLFTILLARRLGSQGFGEYAFIAAVVFLGNALTTFGTDMLLIREIAGRDDLSRLPVALAIQLALSALFVLLLILFTPVLPIHSPASTMALRVYSLALFPLAFYTVFTTALRGRQHMGAYSMLNMSVALLQTLMVWLILRPGSNILTLVVILLMVQVAAALLAGTICAALIPGYRQIWQLSFKQIPGMLQASAPIALLGLFGILYQKLPVTMLIGLSGAAATGWYTAAFRAVEASKTVHLAAFTTLYPAMAQERASSSGEGHWNETFKRSWRLLFAGAGAAAILLFLFASQLVHLLYGAEYGPSIPALKILAWMLIPYTVNTFLSLAYLAAGEERTVARVQLAGLFTLAVLNAWWIPAWGLAGACLATVVAEAAQSVVYGVIRYSQKHNRKGAEVRMFRRLDSSE